MSDFGDFNSSNDPTADFLARERAALGEDADLFSSGDVSTPVAADITSPAADLMMSPPSDVPASSSPALGSTTLSPTAGTPGAAATDYSAFESDFPKAEELETSQVYINILPDIIQ